MNGSSSMPFVSMWRWHCAKKSWYVFAQMLEQDSGTGLLEHSDPPIPQQLVSTRSSPL